MIEVEFCVACTKERANVLLGCMHCVICQECAYRFAVKNNRQNGSYMFCCPECSRKTLNYLLIRPGYESAAVRGDNSFRNNAMNKIVKVSDLELTQTMPDRHPN